MLLAILYVASVALFIKYITWVVLQRNNRCNLEIEMKLLGSKCCIKGSFERDKGFV